MMRACAARSESSRHHRIAEDEPAVVIAAIRMMASG